MEDNKILEAVASMASDKSAREEFAQMLIEYIQPNHVTTDYMSLLMDTRQLKPGDSLVKKIRKGIKVRTWVPGSIGLKSEVTVSDRINYILDGAEVGIMANEWELESGELGTVMDLRNEARLKLRDYYMNKIFTALTTIWTAGNTPNNYTDVGGTVTASALKNMIDRINQTTPGAKAIVGTRAALTPITTFGASWSDGTSSYSVDANIAEIMQTGFLGRYYGVPIIALQQTYDNPEDYNAQLPNDKILVVGEKVGEFITFGDVREKEWTDMQPTPPYWHMDMVQQFGLIIDNAEGIGLLKVS